MNEEGYEDQQPPVMYPSTHMSEGLVRYQLNYTQIIDNIKHKLLGELPQLKEDGSIIWVKLKELRPLLNKKGVNTIVIILSAFIDKNIPLTDWDEDQIMAHTEDLWDSLIELIYQNWFDFEIENKANAMMIMRICITNINAIFCKALGGFTSRNIGKTTQSHEVTQYRPQQMNQQMMPEQPKKGIFGGLLGRG